MWPHAAFGGVAVGLGGGGAECLAGDGPAGAVEASGVLFDDHVQHGRVLAECRRAAQLDTGEVGRDQEVFGVGGHHRSDPAVAGQLLGVGADPGVECPREGARLIR